MSNLHQRPARHFVPCSLLRLCVQCECRGRSGKGASGQAAALRWCGLRFASTSLRCSVSRPRRITRLDRFAHCAQTNAPSQMTTRAAREAASPGLAGRAGPGGPAVRKAQAVPRTVCVPAHLLSAPEARCSLPERAFAHTTVVFWSKTTTGAARQAVPGGGDFCGDEERKRSVGARSALRELTRRSCLSAVSEANEASSATRLKAEHRSGVVAKRRPPQHEPPAGTACRAALSQTTGRTN
jgi:hypothetical protein